MRRVKGTGYFSIGAPKALWSKPIVLGFPRGRIKTRALDEIGVRIIRRRYYIFRNNNIDGFAASCSLRRCVTGLVPEKRIHMYLFKTSGKTFQSVIKNQKHAFFGKPKDWHVGELVLVSKNKGDCQSREKQIQYTMTLRDVRLLRPGEAEQYWPGNRGPMEIPYNLRRHS